jgi:hypothetical protein
MAQRTGRTTTDHEEIRTWVEDRGGWPAVGTQKRGSAGIICIDFSGYTGEGKVEHISWDDFFDRFEDADLAFVYEDKTARGVKSNFNKLVSREAAPARSSGVKTSRRAARSTGSRRAAEPRQAAARVGRAKSPSRAKAKSTQARPKKKTSRRTSAVKKSPSRTSGARRGRR